jgi:hypothetical protein
VTTAPDCADTFDTDHTCQCGARSWYASASRVKCEACGRIWRPLKGWALDPETVPVPAAAKAPEIARQLLLVLEIDDEKAREPLFELLQRGYRIVAMSQSDTDRGALRLSVALDPPSPLVVDVDYRTLVDRELGALRESFHIAGELSAVMLVNGTRKRLGLAP